MMEIQLARNGNAHRFIGLLGGHVRMLRVRWMRATKNPPLAGRVFDTHTLAKNTLNNQKSEFREARGRNNLGADGHRCLEGWQLDRDLHRVPGEVAQRVQAAIDV